MNTNDDKTSAIQAYDGYHKYDKEVAATYEETRCGEIHWRQEKEYLHEYLQGRAIGTLLDLPVGTGRFLPLYTGVCSITGVDVSEDMLTEARARAVELLPGQQIVLEKGDVFALPYPDQAFDVVVVFRLFHLMPPESLEPAIRELCRVAKGEIVVQTYTPPFWYRTLWHRLWRLLPRRPVQGQPKAWSHIRSFNNPQSLFKRLFQKFGFQVRRTTWLSSYVGCEVRATVFLRTVGEQGAECDRTAVPQ